MRAYQIAAGLGLMVALSAPTCSQEEERAAAMTAYVTGANLMSDFDKHVVRSTVEEILAQAGVRIAWLNGIPTNADAAGTAVVVYIRLVRQSTDIHSSGALAYATPFARGVHTITVLVEKIRKTALRESAPLPRILAHVLAHELGHVLQRTAEHAETGLMKAAWDRDDYRAMAKNPLEFTPADVEQIQGALNGLRARAGHGAGGTRGW